MNITRNELKKMIQECVFRVLEIHGAIDDSLSGIAKEIIERLKNNETNFLLGKDEICKFYPYKNCPESLKVKVCQIQGNKPAAYSLKDNSLKISSSLKTFGDSFIISAIMHELNHWINDIENPKGLSKVIQSETNSQEKERIINRITYLFDNSEMNARVTQFKWATMARNATIEKELVTHLNEMLNLINEIKKEDYKEYYSTYGATDSFGTIIEGLLALRAYRKSYDDGKDRFTNLLSEKEFYKTKQSIIKSLLKKYKKFKANIDKIYYDLSQNHGSNSSS